MQNVFVVTNNEGAGIAVIPFSDQPEGIREALQKALSSHYDAAEGKEIDDLTFKGFTGDGQSWSCKTFEDGNDAEYDIAYIDLTMTGFYQ